VSPVASAFHVFASEREQRSIRWYVDDTLDSIETKRGIRSGATRLYSYRLRAWSQK